MFDARPDVWIGGFALITIIAHVAFYFFVVKPRRLKESLDSTKGGYIPRLPVLPPPPMPNWVAPHDVESVHKKLDQIIEMLKLHNRQVLLKTAPVKEKKP